MIKLSIQPHEITQTATAVSFTAFNPLPGNLFEVGYELYDEAGKVIEAGVKTVPASVMAVFSVNPLPLDQVNEVLAGFGVEAISQIE